MLHCIPPLQVLPVPPQPESSIIVCNRWRLIVNAALEASRRPVDELDRALGLDRRHRRIDLNGGQLNNPTSTLYLKALTLSNSKFRNDAFNYQIR